MYKEGSQERMPKIDKFKTGRLKEEKLTKRALESIPACSVNSAHTYGRFLSRREHGQGEATLTYTPEIRAFSEGSLYHQ